jgi:hypothetical protein
MTTPALAKQVKKTRKRGRVAINAISDAMTEKYPGDVMRDPAANRMLMLYIHLAGVIDCAEGRCRDKPCPGLIEHLDFLACKMFDKGETCDDACAG